MIFKIKLLNYHIFLSRTYAPLSLRICLLKASKIFSLSAYKNLFNMIIIYTSIYLEPNDFL